MTGARTAIEARADLYQRAEQHRTMLEDAALGPLRDSGGVSLERVEELIAELRR